MNKKLQEDKELDINKLVEKRPNKKLPKPQRIAEDRLMEKRHIRVTDIEDIIDDDDIYS